MPYSTRLSDAFSAIARGITDDYAESFEVLYPENKAQTRIIKNQITQFVRYLNHISVPFAAALQGPEQFHNAINAQNSKGSMYQAYAYSMSIVSQAFYPSMPPGNTSWFEMVIASRMTPITLFDGTTNYFKLDS